MNKRFLVRAWYEATGQMLYPGEGFTEALLMEVDNASGTLSRVSMGEKRMDRAGDTGRVENLAEPVDPGPALTLMQCTGRRDQADTLIYEGDYVQINQWSNVHGVADRIVTALIEWYDDGFSFNQRFESGAGSHSVGLDYTSQYHPGNTIEVIGNKYQNSDPRLD